MNKPFDSNSILGNTAAVELLTASAHHWLAFNCHCGYCCKMCELMLEVQYTTVCVKFTNAPLHTHTFWWCVSELWSSGTHHVLYHALCTLKILPDKELKTKRLVKPTSIKGNKVLCKLRADKLRMGDVAESLICIDAYINSYTHFILVNIGDVTKSCDIETSQYVLLGSLRLCLKKLKYKILQLH